MKIIAVDVGNSQLKLGLFHTTARSGLDAPEQTTELSTESLDFASLHEWDGLAASGDELWLLASVNDEACERLAAWLAQREQADVIKIAASDIPIATDVTEPDKVGIDRLAAAYAASRLKQADQATIVIDAGTAVTVDAVAADGTFLGGTILPGIRMSAKALAHYTERLPLVELQPTAEDMTMHVPPIGRNTTEAIQAGLLYGVGGAISEIARFQFHELREDAEDVRFFLTGGDANLLWPLLPQRCKHIPHLVLSGIAATRIGADRFEQEETEVTE